MSDAILVLNAGSSSLKFTDFVIVDGKLEIKVGGKLEELYGRARFKARDAAGAVVGEREWREDAPPRHRGALAFLFDWLREHSGDAVVAVGHRVVHGGEHYSTPVILDPAVMKRLHALDSLAPLHQPHNLLPVEIIAEQHKSLPQVACFDTAFHHTAPKISQAFALPPAITERGVRRYGFHGLSYEYIASVLGDYDQRAATGRTIVLHLGNGASMCAIRDGKSIASTMGFTALDGLVMGTRSGNLDPGVVLYLMQELKMTDKEIETLLYKESGLLGVSGVSSDMRELLGSDSPRAKFAVELFVYRIVREIGSLAAALDGLDAIVFTAGIGEHAAAIRAAVASRLAWLGLAFDPAANDAKGPRISRPDSRVAAWVIPTNEELMIAKHCLAMIGR